MLDIKKLLTKITKQLYKEYDQSLTVTLAPLASSAPLSSFGYAAVNAPANVPGNAWAELTSASGWGWLVRMGDSTPPAYRFIVLGSTSGTRTITVRWHWHV